MSLIIKDLDINDLSTDAYCIQVSFFTKDAFRTISVPISKVIQIPIPHGDLIDRSELIKEFMHKTDLDIDDFYNV